MTEKPVVEMQSEKGVQAWGREGGYQNGERLKLTTTSVFWILAPLFLILPWIIYLRNRQTGVRQDPQFTVELSETNRGNLADQIPQIASKDGLPKRKATEVMRSYSTLQVIGTPPKMIPPGSQVKGVLMTGASNGPVKVKTTESLVVEGEVLLESNLILIGQAQSGPDRLFVVFNKLVLPDGTSKQVSAQGYDIGDMIPGLKGSKVRSRVTKFAAAATLNFVGGLSEGLQDTRSAGGIPVKDNSFRNAALNGAGQAALSQGKTMLESAQNDQEVIEVKVGTPLWIVFGGEN